MSTLSVSNIKHPSAASNNIVLDANGNASVAGTIAMGTPFGNRNKIINGTMEIDQQNGGASGTAVGYTVDRWSYASNSSRGTWQQNAGGLTPPAGFNSYLGFTSSSSSALAATDYNGISQVIEGLNTIDLAWGTASARSANLSFWVRSSLTGTFGGALKNNGSTRSFPFSYTINAANTWEYKTIAIPGETTGTWLRNNTNGIEIFLSLGTGTTYRGLAGIWASANYVSCNGETSVATVSGATFYLTGVQLEVGSIATPFERRLYTSELILAQRYLEIDDIPASGSPKISTSGLAQGITHYLLPFKVSKRTTPTVALTYISNIDNSTSAVGVAGISSGGYRGYNTISNGSFFYADAWVRYVARAEL